MLTVNAEIRKQKGKSSNRRLRLVNKIPAIIYGGLKAPLTIALDHDIISNTQKKENFYSDTISLIINGEGNRVKVQEVQRHPFKPKLLHIDFIRT